MFCPRCKSEYREGIESCAECGVPLVSSLPPEDGADLVPVFNTADAALLPIVKSALDAAGIPYLVQGDEHLGLFPLGRFATGVSKRALGAIVHVPAERADETRELLKGVTETYPGES